MYISTCRSGGNIRNNFFKNMLVETGTLSFVDIADSNGTQNFNNSYGSEFLDLDDDGDLDLYVIGADGNDTKIFRNDGNNLFTDVDTITGHKLLSTNGTDLNGSKAVDYDNDGDLDLYFHDNLSSTGNQKLYRNDGNWKFTDVTVSRRAQYCGRRRSGRSRRLRQRLGRSRSRWRSGPDRPQQLDIQRYTPHRSASTSATPPPTATIGCTSNSPDRRDNTTGIGATLYATMNEGTPEEVTLRREANTNIGTFNQSDLPVHFGLGAATLIDELLIDWPDGTKQSLYDVAVDQYLTVEYLPGDYSGNGIVDAADYAIWRDGLGTTYKQSDYDVWKAHYGQSLSGSGGGAVSAVPEPTSLALLLIGLAAFANRRRYD